MLLPSLKQKYYAFCAVNVLRPYVADKCSKICMCQIIVRQRWKFKTFVKSPKVFKYLQSGFSHKLIKSTRDLNDLNGEQLIKFC